MDKILESFIKNPEKEFYVRQIAKLEKKSPTTISKYLKEFEKKNILKSEKKLNHLLFRANTKNPKFKQLKLNYNLNLINDSELLDYLIRQFNYPKAIILFGSFSKAEDIPISDIDLFIVSTYKKEINLKKYEKILNHKIQIFVKNLEMIVLKFGGTSVGSASSIKNVANLINTPVKKVVVLSALSGTTNSLVEIAAYLYKKNNDSANEAIITLEKHYFNVVEELFSTSAYKEKGNELIFYTRYVYLV